MTTPTASERERLYGDLLTVLLENTKAAKGAVFVLEPESRHHFIRHQQGFGEDDYVRYKIKFDDPVMSALEEAGEPTAVNSPDGDTALHDYLAESGEKAVLLAPVLAQGVLVGMLDLRGKKRFNKADAKACADTSSHVASIIQTIPSISSIMPASAEGAASDATPEEAPTSTGEGTGLSTEVMKTLKKANAAAAEAAAAEETTPPPSPAAREKRRRPYLLPQDLLKEALSPIFRCLPLDYVGVSVSEEGILATYFVGPRPAPEALREALLTSTREALSKAPYPGTGAEFVQDEFIALEPGSAPLEGEVTGVHPLAVPLPRFGSEARTTLVLAGVQVDRVGFSEDSEGLLAQFGGLLKNLFLQRLRSLDYRQGYLSLLNQVLRPIEKTLPYIKHHSIAVANYSKQMALRLELDEMHVENIIVAAILHDVGLLDIDYGILREKGELSEKDLKEIRKHPIFGRDFAEQVAFPYPVAPLVYAHHERWDGKGYPEGLRGEAIPLGARIIAVAEAFDAMTSRHSYKSTLAPAAAIEELRKNSGTQFDPRIVEVFIRVMRRPRSK